MSEVVKLLDYKHCNMGDTMTNVVLVEELIQRGYAVCGGDIKELRACERIAPDIVVVGGGGQIYETPRMRDGALYGERGLLSLSRKHPVYFLGTGFNGLWFSKEERGTDFEKVKKDWKEVLDNAEVVSLRDKGSIEACEKVFGAKIDERYSHFPCPAFALRNRLSPAISKNKKLAIYSIQALPERKPLESKIVRSLRHARYKIAFMPHSSADEKIYEERQYGERENESLLKIKDNPIAALQVIKQAGIHITSRMHGLVASVITGTPLIHVGKDQAKIRWIMEEIGLTNYPYIYNWTTCKPTAILSSIKRASKDSASLSEELGTIAEKASTESKNHFSAI